MANISNIKIFVVEDEKVFQEMLVFHIEDQLGYEVEAFSDGAQLLLNLYKNPDIVLLDYHLEDQSGLEVLKQIKAINPEIHVLLVSGQKNIPVAVDILKYGAFDYVVKNDKVFEVITEKIQLMANISESLRLYKRKKIARTFVLSVVSFLVSSIVLVKLLA